MTGLWADGWFYISSAGLLVSGVLFFFLLGQYRAASEAADVEDDAASVETVDADRASHDVRPVFVREERAAAAVASVPHDPPAETPVDKPASEPDRKKDAATTTGGISPAVVYLQNIKSALAELHDEVRALSKRVDDELGSVASRDDALIERLAELTRTVESLKSASVAPSSAAPAAEAPAPTPAPKPKKEKKAPVVDFPLPEPERVTKAEPAAEPRIELSAPAGVGEPKTDPIAVTEPKTDPVVVAAPEPAPVTQPVEPVKSPTPDETIRMELGDLIQPAAAQKAPEPAAEPAPAEAPAEVPEEKPRRGPVWPV